MNYNIIDGHNSKVRSVCFEEIEKIVDTNYEKLLTENNEEDSNYQEIDDNDILCLKMDYEINYLKKDLLHIMKYYGLSTRKK